MRKTGTYRAAAVAVIGMGAVAAAGFQDSQSPRSRVLRKEVVVPAPLQAVWDSWTTNEGLKFVSSKSNVELRVGGAYEWFLDQPADARGRRGGEGVRILAFERRKMLQFDWTFPPSIPSLRLEDERTVVTVLLEEELRGSVRIIFLQSGWKEGEDWDAGYAYFDQAWDYVLDRLRGHFDAPRPTTGS